MKAQVRDAVPNLGRCVTYGWPAASIVNHAGGEAHLPGCTHIVPADIRPAVYAWVPTPSPGAWRRLAPSSPLHATRGNVERAAVSRCQSCDAAQWPGRVTEPDTRAPACARPASAAAPVSG